MFRSVRFYSLTSPWPGSEQDLSDALAAAAFKPCGSFTERSSGWESPAGNGVLAHRVGGADLLRLRSQARVLPAAAVNEALEMRIEDYRARTQEEPSRRAKRKLKEQTRDELLPKALLKSDRTNGLCILSEQIIAIGTASESRAERFLEHLRAPLGTLTVKPLAFKRPFTELVSRVFAGDAPGLNLGRECRMQDPSDRKGVVRWQDMDLTHATVRKCLKDGMQLTHVGFEFANVLGGVLDANGVIGKLKLAGLDEPPGLPADTSPQALPGDDAMPFGEDPLASLDAELALLGGTLRQLLVAMRKMLGDAT